MEFIMSASLSIIIPCCNEADNIPKLVKELVPVLAELAQSRPVEVVFVDDGSKPGPGRRHPHRTGGCAWRDPGDDRRRRHLSL
jgi:hypothetical protein